MPDKKLKSIVNRLPDEANKFRDAFNKGLKKAQPDSRRNDANATETVDGMVSLTKIIKDNFGSRQAAASDVDDLLRRGSIVNSYMNRYGTVTGADAEWTKVKQDLETMADAHGVRWTGPATSVKAYRLNDNEVRSILERIRPGSERFAKDVEALLKLDRSTNTQAKESFKKTIKDFAKSAEQAKGRVGDDDSGAPQVEELLQKGSEITQLLITNRNRLNQQVREDWTAIRKDLNEIAKAYRVSLRQFDLQARETNRV